MVFLHPVFSGVFILLMVASYLEVYTYRRKNSIFLWVAAILLIFAAGFRDWVGADYPIYRNLFAGFPLYTTYGDVVDKALFRPNSEEIEWIFVLINKVIFDLGLPFYMMTFVMALMSITLKFTTIYKYVAYPSLGAFFYFMPLFFFEDSGQIRQGMSIAILVFSFRYIASRNLFMFLLFIYLALGFHKTAIVFLPAYWLVLVPMNRARIFAVIIISILLSPFEVYRLLGGMLEGLAAQDVAKGFDAYVEDSTYGQSLGFGLSDIIKIIFIIILLLYDKAAEEKVYYYEYMRNLAVVGLCMFYVMRGNTIFAVRLPGVYLYFLSVFVMPNIAFAVKDSVKRILHMGFSLYLFLMYFNFSRGNGLAGRFTPDRYNNVLLRR